MMTSSYDPIAVTDLLKMLVEGQENLFWKMRCSYADGQGQTLMEVVIYEGACRRIKGKIAFNEETGIVKNFRYRGYKQRISGNIVDTLLDLINFEKYCLLEVV